MTGYASPLDPVDAFRYGYSMNYLSKTRYLLFLQCPKLLWLSVNRPSAIPPPGESELHRMEEGHHVEETARLMFDGRLIGHDYGLASAVAETESALYAPSCGDVLFRPVFRAGRLVAEADIVRVRRDGLLNLYEVKSSSGVKAEHLPDVAFQKYVAEQSGIQIGETAVITVRTDYVRRGSVDVTKLFTIMDTTPDIEPHLAEVEGNVAEALRIMDSPVCPDIPTGPHCSGCPLRETADACWAEVDAEPCNVFTLYRLQSKRAWGWYGQGYLRSRDIPASYPLTDRQRIQIRAEVTGKPHVDKRHVRDFIDGLKFPLYFLDFETFASPVPLIDNSSPYEQIPFQFSLHILGNSLDEQPRHVSWIWDGDMANDPRGEMLHRLEGLLDRGTVIAWNAVFEKTVLKRAAEVFPDYKGWVKGLLPRFDDLLVPFRSFHLYHPEQHGSCSLKLVLPAWTGRSYEGMEISGGEQAGREYMQVMFGGGGGKEDLMRNLEEYCGLDTGGMLEILKVMRGLCWG